MVIKKIDNLVQCVKGQWIRVPSAANGQPCYAGAGSQAAEKEKLDWRGV